MTALAIRRIIFSTGVSLGFPPFVKYLHQQFLNSSPCLEQLMRLKEIKRKKDRACVVSNI